MGQLIWNEDANDYIRVTDVVKKPIRSYVAQLRPRSTSSSLARTSNITRAKSAPKPQRRSRAAVKDSNKVEIVPTRRFQLSTPSSDSDTSSETGVDISAILEVENHGGGNAVQAVTSWEVENQRMTRKEQEPMKNKGPMEREEHRLENIVPTPQASPQKSKPTAVPMKSHQFPLSRDTTLSPIPTYKPAPITTSDLVHYSNLLASVPQ